MVSAAPRRTAPALARVALLESVSQLEPVPRLEEILSMMPYAIIFLFIPPPACSSLFDTCPVLQVSVFQHATISPLQSVAPQFHILLAIRRLADIVLPYSAPTNQKTSNAAPKPHAAPPAKAIAASPPPAPAATPKRTNALVRPHSNAACRRPPEALVATTLHLRSRPRAAGVRRLR